MYSTVLIKLVQAVIDGGREGHGIPKPHILRRYVADGIPFNRVDAVVHVCGEDSLVVLRAVLRDCPTDVCVFGDALARAATCADKPGGVLLFALAYNISRLLDNGYPIGEHAALFCIDVAINRGFLRYAGGRVYPGHKWVRVAHTCDPKKAYSPNKFFDIKSIGAIANDIAKGGGCAAQFSDFVKDDSGFITKNIDDFVLFDATFQICYNFIDTFCIESKNYSLVTSLRGPMEKIFNDRYISKVHVLLALHILGYDIDWVCPYYPRIAFKNVNGFNNLYKKLLNREAPADTYTCKAWREYSRSFPGHPTINTRPI